MCSKLEGHPTYEEVMSVHVSGTLKQFVALRSLLYCLPLELN